MYKYILTFLISMVPIIELRGAIPIGVSMGVPIWSAYLISIIGNMIPVPFIFFFARKFLTWGSKKKFKPLKNICDFFLKKGKKAGDKLTKKSGKGLYIALMLFVGIPLPGTGAWTGTLAASFLDLDFKKSTIATMLGVLLAGIIIGILTEVFHIAIINY